MSIYAGAFLIAFSALTLEITLTRLLSVLAWYHLAFFAISAAMLGMTAGATMVYLKPRLFAEERLRDGIAVVCFAYALAVPTALIVLCLTPLELGFSPMKLLYLLLATTACALPFHFSGMALTAVVTKCRLPIGRMYASDLIGASLGCLFVLVGLELVDAPSLVLLCGALGALAGLLFVWRTPSRQLRGLGLALLLLLAVAGVANSMTLHGIRPFVVKGHVERADSFLVEQWNSFSRVVAFKASEGAPHYWGPSPLAPQPRVTEHMMNIDGQAGTTMKPFATRADLEHLRFDVVNVAYYLRPTGGACVIGVGGGRDVQSALCFGHQRILGIEVNPIFIDLLQNRLRSFAGIADRKEVELVVDEARSRLTRTTESFALIQMSLIDTWASTGAGAFSLSENALYTVEAWQVFLGRLAQDGIFTVSRWHSPADLGETGRVVSLALATLFKMGVRDVSAHLAMVTTTNVATLLICRRPFKEQEVAELRRVCAELQYGIAFLPGAPPGDPLLARMLAARSPEELAAVVADTPLNYEPATDENPYFFNMLRLRHLGVAFRPELHILRGNLLATFTLAALICTLSIVTLATIVLPLFIHGRRAAGGGRPRPILWSAALYFALIGAGFMFTEIALIQRLSVFLGHPVYALGVLLFTIILSAGLGSALSEKLPLVQRPWIYLFPILTALGILVVRFALAGLVPSLITAPLLTRAATSVLVIFPLGLLMGFFLPTGMKLVSGRNASEMPWYWAVNGICGVLCAALAVFIAIYLGISVNLYVAAVCYGVVPACLHRIADAGAEGQADGAG